MKEFLSNLLDLNEAIIREMEKGRTNEGYGIHCYLDINRLRESVKVLRQQLANLQEA